MGIRVCKFGGSSLADAGQMRKVRAIVEADETRRYVVPSAPGRRSDDDQKITDLLYGAQSAASMGDPVAPFFDRVAERFGGIVSDLGLDFDLDPIIAELLERIESGADSDYAASRGEYLSGLVLARFLDRPFIDPAEMVRFDSEGRFLPEETRVAVSERLARESTGVIPGFYGARPDGSIKTFSRGGSDVTGAIVAQAVGANLYENWTDVSGILMTDPRIVDGPRTIDLLTYRELRELAYMGATVLHDEAIFPVREAGIPVQILNTNDPEAPGTRIARGDLEETSAHRVTGIAGRKDFTILALEKTLMNAEVGFGRRLLSVLAGHGISWEHMPSGIDTLSLVLKSNAFGERREQILNDIQSTCQPDALEIYPDIALIATVGRGMSHTPGTAARLFGALADAGINIRMIDQGSSELNIIVGVENGDFEKAVRAIYEAFAEE